MLETLAQQGPWFPPALIGLAVFAFVIGFFGLVLPSGLRFASSVTRQYETYFVDHLEFKPISVTAFELLLLLLVVGCLILLLLFPLQRSAIYLTCILASVIFLPRAIYFVLKTDRRKKIDDVLPNVLQQLAANFRTTSDISRALHEVSETAPAPMNHELRLIRQKENDLKSFPEALDHARRRIGSDWFDVVAAVLRTTYEHGGKESDALLNLSRVFVQLKKMRERLDTATSEGKMSMRMIMIMPFIVIIGAVIVVPDMAQQTWDSFTGRLMLGAAGIVYILAIFLAFRLAAVKV